MQKIVMDAKTKQKLIILSVLSLLNVMFVPIWDTWGGLIPNHVDNDFFDVVEVVLEYGLSAIETSMGVQLTMYIFIPSVFMLFFALLSNKGFFLTSNIVGIAGWFKSIIDLGMSSDLYGDIFDFEDGSISIGSWFAIAIFLTSFIIFWLSERETETNHTYQMPNLQ